MQSDQITDFNNTVEYIKQIIIKASAQSPRYIAAIAGAPGSGKTTLCESLQQEIAKETTVAVVPMDGFHYDNEILDQLNLTDRKGAPNTFDAVGLQLFLHGLKNQLSPMAAPVFDRQQDHSRSSARLIHPTDKIILVEGNYLLCEQPPWTGLNALFDYTIMLSVPMETLEARLIQRWLDHNHTADEAKTRANYNDLPNAKYVVENSSKADCHIGKSN